MPIQLFLKKTVVLHNIIIKLKIDI